MWMARQDSRAPSTRGVSRGGVEQLLQQRLPAAALLFGRSDNLCLRDVFQFFLILELNYWNHPGVLEDIDEHRIRPGPGVQDRNEWDFKVGTVACSS